MQQQVWDAIGRSGMVSRREIEARTGLPLQVVLAALWTLKETNVVQAHGAARSTRYSRVAGARRPIDTRGRHPRSRANLEPCLPDTLRERWLKWKHGDAYRPTAVPGIELERCWR